MTLLGIGYGYYFSERFFASNKPELVENIFNLLKLFWLVPLPYALLNFFSFIRYPVINKPLVSQPSFRGEFHGRVYFRYVTRGLNPKLIAANVDRACQLLSHVLPPDRWHVEVVTDHELPNVGQLEDHQGLVTVISVPDDYVPPNGTLFKARSLHYALGVSAATAEDWLVHLDEETLFDQETIWAIFNFIEQETTAVGQHQRPYPRIGQGIILYGTHGVVNWMTTLADSIRVGDDYGRFRLQYEHGKAVFGIHGSFIVVNNGVEQMVGLDHGPAASITEDAYFALYAQSMGVEFGFIHTYMYEKSPFTVRDFIKQRHRWFGGLWYCVLHNGLPWHDRIVLATFMVMWSVSWLCIAMVYINLLYPTGTPVWLAVAGGVSFAYYVTLYLVGYFKTFDWHAGRARFLSGLLVQILFIPIFSLMEGAGVLYGLLAPPKGFYIVQKEVD